MRARIRLLLVVEAVTFALAAAVHAGIGVRGYEHAKARIAESIIAAVLAVGAVVGWWRSGATRRTALWAQGFALVATLVGVLTIVLGVGPRTVPDVIYHVAIVGVLTHGLVAARSIT
jgi:hypothetical protein